MQAAAYVILIVLQGLILISLWTILYQAVKQQGRLLLRLDDLDHRLTEAGLGAGPGTSTGQGGLEVGTPVTSPGLPDPDGRLISLDDFRGKRVLLVHWNPDCAFCELLAPDLAQFQADLRTSNVQLVLASPEDAESNRELALEHGLTCPILLMPDDGPWPGRLSKTRARRWRTCWMSRVRWPNPWRWAATRSWPWLAGSSVTEPRGSGSPASALCPKAASSGTASRRVPSLRRSACPTFAAGRLPLRITEVGGCSWSSRTRTAGPARNSAPHLVRIHREYRDGGLVVFMVTRGDVAENRRKADRYGFEFPVVLQDRWRLSKEYGIFAMPVAFLIDEEGIITRDVAQGVSEILALVPEQMVAVRT